MNHFRQQLADQQQRLDDRRAASEEAYLDQTEDILTMIETCQEHEAYWQERLRKKTGYGEDIAFPDHPNHRAFLAKLKQQKAEQEFRERITARRLRNT